MLFLHAGLLVHAVEFVKPGPDTVSEDGVVALGWSDAGAPGDEFELQQASDPGFSDVKTRYEGPDRGSVITGLAEGEYFFRVRTAGAGAWSPPVKVTVKYMGMGLVWTLMGVGIVVFIATVGAILRGHFREGAES